MKHDMTNSTGHMQATQGKVCLSFGTIDGACLGSCL
ncbi:hypothetical protein E2C01_009315 [Portunus trituberculatus]|uniref:Uncharacterized protein n=1 Tax=Portunus trituberculatus TaxID=210409 RepID=A0A5B7D470_PORTR|nr:hypothetical protein [Portunus trituberculatus]